jgi:hypothetical protein
MTVGLAESVDLSNKNLHKLRNAVSQLAGLWFIGHATALNNRISTRAIHVREPLPLLLAAFSLLSYFENDRFENPDGPLPDVSTRRQELVKLIGQASRIETDDKFFQLIHGFCVHACAFERCQTEAEVEELEAQLKPQEKPLLGCVPVRTLQKPQNCEIIFLSHCNDICYFTSKRAFHASESWFRENHWTIWNGAPSSTISGRVAWLVRSTA